MARMLPPEVKKFQHSSERKVYEVLHQDLPASVTVFYSFWWLHSGGNGDADDGRDTAVQGEGDFVIFDPARGVMVIEVKGGTVTCKRGEWRQKNRRRGTEKTSWPQGQANTTSHEIRKRVRRAVPEAASLLFCHAVWFPECTPDRKSLPWDCPSEILLDAKDVAHPEVGIRRVFEFWRKRFSEFGGIGTKYAKRVFEELAPSSGFAASIGELETEFFRLTRNQAKIIDFLDEQPHAAVHGAAGTGKTLIALEKARR